jgi:hypothetical protein
MVAAEVYCTDVWLRAFVADLEGGSSAVWRSTALIVTYDESTSTDTSGFSANGQTINGGHIYTAVVSCYAHRTSSGTAYRSYHSYTDWNVLTTAEWLLGLGSGHFPNDSWSAWPPMTDLFTGTSAC